MVVMRGRVVVVLVGFLGVLVLKGGVKDES